MDYKDFESWIADAENERRGLETGLMGMGFLEPSWLGLVWNEGLDVFVKGCPTGPGSMGST